MTESASDDPRFLLGPGEIPSQVRARRLRRWVFIGVAVLAIAAIANRLTTGHVFGNPLREPELPVLTAAEYRQQALKCVQVHQLTCAEGNWAAYVRLRPNDGPGLANLGIVMSQRDEHAGAVVQFKKAIEVGEGTYDLFAYYADSLARLGRTDEAIDWSYKALSVVPTLVDVRGKLAKLLVARQRPYEALALLQSFDANAEATGRPPYFTGQRIAIESAMAQADSPSPASGASSAMAAEATLRLPAFHGHFVAPITIGIERASPFMVDTGATRTSLSRTQLEESKVPYKVVEKGILMQTADGRRTRADAITIERLRVGPFELKNVAAVTCDGCMPLLGQSTLSSFDLRSSRTQGVEFLTLVRR